MKSERRIVLAVLTLIVLAIALAAWSTRTSASDSAERIAQDPRTLPTDTNTSPASSTHEVLDLPVPKRVEVFDDVVRWTLLGRVVDDQHKPMREFGVRAVRRSELGTVLEEREWPVSEQSDGAFALENLTPGAWEIAPFAPRFALLMSRRFYEPETARPEYRLMPWGRVRGVVLDPTGAPVPYARVLVKTAVVAQADEFGHFEFALAPNEVLLRAESKDFCPSAEVALDISRERELDGVRLTLLWPAELRVRLTDASGAPLEGWSVSITAASVDPVPTDRDGVATVRLSSVVEAVCSVRDPRGKLHGSHEFEIRCGESRSLHLSQPPGPPVRVRGRIDDASVARWTDRHEQSELVRLGPEISAASSRRRNNPTPLFVSARYLDPLQCIYPLLPCEVSEGRFELLLPSAGPWELSLARRPSPFGSHLARVELYVPAVELFEFDWRE